MSETKTHKVTLIPGDGIGPQIGEEIELLAQRDVDKGSMCLERQCRWALRL